MTDQLTRLAEPFEDSLVHSNPSGGGSYVKHHVVVQRLLAIVGPYDFELVKVIRGYVPEVAPNPSGTSDRAKNGSPALTDAVVGVVCRLTCIIDGRAASIEDAGDCEQPHNWPHDGARLKDAMSDAIKRCSARIGVGLHLWSQDEYQLHDQLDDRPRRWRELCELKPGLAEKFGEKADGRTFESLNAESQRGWLAWAVAQ